MEKLTYFYLKGCPYCKQADKYLNELFDENPDYKKIVIDKIEETEQKALADSYDYYFVPTFYMAKTKLFEGAANKEDIKAVLEKALKTEKVLV